MATNNVLNDTAPSLTVNGGLTVTLGNTTLTPIASTAATGVVTVSNAGVLAEVETGALGTVLVGDGSSPKFLSVGTSGARLVSQGAGNDPQWLSGYALSQYAVVVGSASGSITTIPVATTGQTLMGNTGANPTWTGSPSYSGNITVGSGNLAITAGNLNLHNTTTQSIGNIFIDTYGAGLAFHNRGTNNLFIGQSVGNYTFDTTYNNDNIFIGGYYLAANLSGTSGILGSYNICIGSLTAAAITTGNSNTLVGEEASPSLSTGSGNTAIGTTSLYNVTTGSNSTGIGYNQSTGAHTKSLFIGSQTNANADNVFNMGSGTGTGNGQLNKTYISGIQTITVTGAAVLVSTSDQLGVAASSERFKENIQDMSDDNNKFMKLRPVSFNYKNSKDKNIQYGLIAEEVSEIYPELVCYGSDGKPFSVHYDRFPAILLNVIQDLNKRADLIEFKRSR
jgi:hypothetical protein